jgi:hypothetical protein
MSSAAEAVEDLPASFERMLAKCGSALLEGLMGGTS